MAKATITQRAKQLVFMCAEAEEMTRLRLHFDGIESQAARYQLSETAEKFRQRLLVLRELLGQGPSRQSIADGIWSARTRYAEEHHLNKYDLDY